MIENPDADGKYTIHVLVPAGDQCSTVWAIALANMLAYTMGVLGDKFNLATHSVLGTYIHRAREDLIRGAAGDGGHYLLWCDSDHSFPMDALVRLLQHDKAMVGINYTTRRFPPRYVAIKRTAAENPGNGAVCATRDDSTGLETVEALGFGLVLMKMAVIPTLPEEGPWFFFEHSDEGNHVGEDVWFCRLVREAGWEIHVDHDLSKECTHNGAMNYKLDYVWALEGQEDYHGDYDVQRVADGGGELDEPERLDDEDS